MVTLCNKTELNIIDPSETAGLISDKFGCTFLQGALLSLRGVTEDSSMTVVNNWLHPDLRMLLDELELGESNNEALDLIAKLDNTSDVVVYGDYDVDGITSTSIAIELCRARKAHVRYFIPHRFNQGYGMHLDVIKNIAARKCDLVIVVDCGSSNVEEVAYLRKHNIPVIIFDHHLVEKKPAESNTMVNPQIKGDRNAKCLCAAGVIWAWLWKNEMLDETRLYKLLDLVALATIADCVSLSSPLNRALVKEGLGVLRRYPRPGLFILMDKLRLTPRYVDTEDLAMKVIPCLNAAGRLYIADLAVQILFPCSNMSERVDRIISLNEERRNLSGQILEQIEKEDHDGFEYVLMNRDWQAGVLSSVASRVCNNKNAPVALVATNGDVLRGTLRMPNGGNAVEILKALDPILNTWGGHKFAAGFSVSPENWVDLRRELENALSEVEVVREQVTTLNFRPSELNLDIWKQAEMIGPFGLDNPRPKFYFDSRFDMAVSPLGKRGKHVKIETDNCSLLGFGAADMLEANSNPLGWVYTPRFNTWRNVTNLQFILDKIIVA